MRIRFLLLFLAFSLLFSPALAQGDSRMETARETLARYQWLYDEEHESALEMFEASLLPTGVDYEALYIDIGYRRDPDRELELIMHILRDQGLLEDFLAAVEAMPDGGAGEQTYEYLAQARGMAGLQTWLEAQGLSTLRLDIDGHESEPFQPLVEALAALPADEASGTVDLLAEAFYANMEYDTYWGRLMRCCEENEELLLGQSPAVVEALAGVNGPLLLEWMDQRLQGTWVDDQARTLVTGMVEDALTLYKPDANLFLTALLTLPNAELDRALPALRPVLEAAGSWFSFCLRCHERQTEVQAQGDLWLRLAGDKEALLASNGPWTWSQLAFHYGVKNTSIYAITYTPANPQPGRLLMVSEETEEAQALMEELAPLMGEGLAFTGDPDQAVCFVEYTEETASAGNYIGAGGSIPAYSATAQMEIQIAPTPRDEWGILGPSLKITNEPPLQLTTSSAQGAFRANMPSLQGTEQLQNFPKHVKAWLDEMADDGT